MIYSINCALDMNTLERVSDYLYFVARFVISSQLTFIGCVVNVALQFTHVYIVF